MKTSKLIAAALMICLLLLGLALAEEGNINVPGVDVQVSVNGLYPPDTYTIQLKADGIAEEVARVVRRAGAVEWTGFNEGTLQRLIDIRKFLPETYIFYDVGKKDVPVEDYIDVCRTNGFQELVMHHQYVTAEKCATIRAAGILPGAWNIGDAEKMRQLLDMGVFRIYADAPLVMLDVVKEREKRC